MTNKTPILKYTIIAILVTMAVILSVQFLPDFIAAVAVKFNALSLWIKVSIISTLVLISFAVTASWVLRRFKKTLWRGKGNFGTVIVTAIGSITKSMDGLWKAESNLPADEAKLAMRSIALSLFPPHTRAGKNNPFDVLHGFYAIVITVAAALGSFRAAYAQRRQEASKVKAKLEEFCRGIPNVMARITISGIGEGNTGVSFIHSYADWFLSNDVIKAPIHFLIYVLRPSRSTEEDLSADFEQESTEMFTPFTIDQETPLPTGFIRPPEQIIHSHRVTRPEPRESDEVMRTRVVADTLKWCIRGIIPTFISNPGDGESDRRYVDDEVLKPFVRMVSLISSKNEGEELLKLKEPSVFGPALATTLSYPITIMDSWDIIFAMSKLEKEPMKTFIDGVELKPFPSEQARRRMAILGMGEPEIGASLQTELLRIYNPYPYGSLPIFLHPMDVSWFKAFILIELSESEIESAIPGITGLEEWNKSKQALYSIFERKAQ